VTWENASLEEAKSWLRDNLDQGANCPCCTQKARIYKRQINSSMAYVLILLDRYFRESTDEWLHVPSYLTGLGLNPRLSAAFRGDWAKLKYWGFLEEKPDVRDDGSPHAGFHRITPAGIQFVRGETRVLKYMHIYNNHVLHQSGPPTSIQDALGQKFSYNELMKG